MKIILNFSFLLIAILLVGCSNGDINIDKSKLSETESQNIDESEDTDNKLINIVDLTEINQIPTGSALEEFYKDDNYIYYFPTIKSEYIECQFSDGTTMKFMDALNSNIVAISDLDTYNINYWIADKDGNLIDELNNPDHDICDGVPLAPEGFTKP